MANYDARNARAQARLASRGVQVPLKGAVYAERKANATARGLSLSQARGHAKAGRGIQELRRQGVRIPAKAPDRTVTGGPRRPAPPRGNAFDAVPFTLREQLTPRTTSQYLADISSAASHQTYADVGAMTLQEAVETVLYDGELLRLAQLGMVYIIERYDMETGELEGYDVWVLDNTP